jgi:hypothetical protein
MWHEVALRFNWNKSSCNAQVVPVSAPRALGFALLEDDANARSMDLRCCDVCVGFLSESAILKQVVQ